MHTPFNFNLFQAYGAAPIAIESAVARAVLRGGEGGSPAISRAANQAARNSSTFMKGGSGFVSQKNT